MRTVALFGALAALPVTPALGGQPAGGAADNIVVTSQQFDNKVVCKSEAATGSRFVTRVCHTNKEWADLREQSMRDMQEASRDKFGVDGDALSDAVGKRQ